MMNKKIGRLIKNINGKATASLEIYNKKYVIRPKCSIVIYHNERSKNPADILLEKYSFLIDATSKKYYKVNKPKIALGKKI